MKKTTNKVKLIWIGAAILLAAYVMRPTLGSMVEKAKPEPKASAIPPKLPAAVPARTITPPAAPPPPQTAAAPVIPAPADPPPPAATPNPPVKQSAAQAAPSTP